MFFALLACKGGESGSLELKFEGEATTMKVGAALAVPRPFGDGFIYQFMLYNEGVKSAPCKGDDFHDPNPVGGTNWAVSLEMSPIGDPLRATDKNKIYPKAMPRFYFVRTQGESKGSSVRGVADSGSNATLTVLSVDGDVIRVRVDATGAESFMKGEFKAKICKPE